MPLSLSETQTIQEMANLLYSFLPGQAHPYADQKISFAGIANELGLRNFWPGGSKLPAITSLLEKTLEIRRDIFCSLILEIVKRGINYKNNKGSPITREEIEELNHLILKVKFKIPELWDRAFLTSLRTSSHQKIQDEEAIDHKKRSESIEKLKKISEVPPQERGFAFERFLNELFEVFNLSPRGSFRLVGEQIDGSLELDGETYLIEAKWQNNQANLQDLLTFHGKIAGKATWSRGIFISYTGFTEEALIAFSRGRPTNLITLDSQDLYFILIGNEGAFLNLDEAIRIKVRHAAETGNIGVTVYELLIQKGQK